MCVNFCSAMIKWRKYKMKHIDKPKAVARFNYSRIIRMRQLENYYIGKISFFWSLSFPFDFIILNGNLLYAHLSFCLFRCHCHKFCCGFHFIIVNVCARFVRWIFCRLSNKLKLTSLYLMGKAKQSRRVQIKKKSASFSFVSKNGIIRLIFVRIGFKPKKCSKNFRLLRKCRQTNEQ